MSKKIIAFFFSFAIAVSLLSFSAFAGSYGGGLGRSIDFWSISYQLWLDGYSDWNPGGIFDLYVNGGGRKTFQELYEDYLSILPSTTVSSSDDLTSTATSYLYNGVELPALPEWDKETYPYAIIGYKGGAYKLTVCSLALGITADGECKTLSCGASWQNYSPQDGEFVMTYEDSIPDGYLAFDLSVYTAIWSNTDIFNSDGTVYLAASDPIPVGGSDTTSDTKDRIGLYMEELDAWNQSHPYQSGQYTPNYYITSDSGNTLYSPAVFSESSMIFTEPVTGTQYPCTKWLYHYTEDNVLTYGGVPIEGDYIGSYILTLTNPVTINGHSCLNYWIVYMDDGVYIAPFYADAADNVYFPTYQFFTYAVVAQTECGIGNHSYTVETLSAPTCGTSGERLYTCSICGDEYVQDIPATGAHSYEYSVSQEPTCAVEGVALYTCSSCGNQYTEPIAVLEHDWLATEVTATTYALPEGTSCPSCAGTAFTHTRSGDIYTCTCSDCSTEWSVNAVVTYGSTTYTCSRCGESYVEQEDEDSGLFTALANFLSDGITWVTGKFTELAESINGIHDSFRSYMEQIKGVGGDFPAFLGAAVALVPEDFMAVIWFSVVALVILAVWLKFFK